MARQDDIQHQRSLLEIHRRTLGHMLRQAAAYGGVDFAPSATTHTIRTARADIERIKEILRGWGVTIDDLPDDQESVTPPVVHGTRPAATTVNIYGPIHSGSTSIGGQQTIEQMEVSMGDTFNISNVSGSVL